MERIIKKKSFRSFAVSAFNKLFIYDKWNIGYVLQSPQSLIENKKFTSAITWLPESRIEYAADPFGMEIKGNICLYYEELSFWKGKGEIMMIDHLHFKSKRKVLGIARSSVHLSYPYLFNADGKYYCIPETSAEKQVGLYQIDENNPNHFTKIKVLVQGDAFVDSSIIFYNDKYWLFTSVSNQPGKLYIYHSDNLLKEFSPHALNPIPVANAVSRSAGKLFIVDQKLYMPSQNPKRCYGGSVVMSEITELTETDFTYNTLFELEPQSPYNEGLHTLCFVNDLLIVDGKRRVFHLLGPFKKLAMKLRNKVNTLS